MIVNVWLALSDAAQDVVLESLNWDEVTQGDYTGPLRNRSRRLFEYMQDNVNRRRLFKKATISGTVYNLWSLDFDDEKETLQKVKDEIDYLIGEYPNQITVMGAWNVATGAQVGGYGIHPRLGDFMPDVWDGVDELNPTFVPASGITDVNLLYGQAPRDFS